MLFCSDDYDDEFGLRKTVEILITCQEGFELDPNQIECLEIKTGFSTPDPSVEDIIAKFRAGR